MSIPATEATSGLGYLMPTSDTSATDADKNMFMQLMVAQLRYQDPMNPTDTSAFLAQSAQFTSLEKMQDVADATNALLGTQLAFGAGALVGKPVSYYDADGVVQQGSVSGVRFESTGPILDVGGADVPIALLVSIGNTTTPAAPSDTSGTDSTPIP